MNKRLNFILISFAIYASLELSGKLLTKLMDCRVLNASYGHCARISDALHCRKWSWGLNLQFK